MKWNPYPKKQPPKRVKEYLVTYRTHSRHLCVGTDMFSKRDEIRGYHGVVREAGWRFNDDVTAWTELPEPYRPKK